MRIVWGEAFRDWCLYGLAGDDWFVGVQVRRDRLSPQLVGVAHA